MKKRVTLTGLAALVVAATGMMTACVRDATTGDASDAASSAAVSGAADDGEQPDTTEASPPAPGVLYETHFADPRKAGGQDMEILNELIRLIDNTPEGESIRLAIHSISVNAVERAIVRAKARHVEVLVAHNGADYPLSKKDDQTPLDLAKDLGPDSHHWCGNIASTKKITDVGGCISSAKDGIMHSKLATFSKTTDGTNRTRSWVSWFGSANMTYHTGANTFNNTVTVYGDKTLYDDFVQKYFDLLWPGRQHFKDNDFYDVGAGRGYFGSSASHVTVYASPEQQTDLVVNRLKWIAPDDQCEIRVSQASMHKSRQAIADELTSLHRAGCKISVTAGSGGVEKAWKDMFDKEKLDVRYNVIHDKYVLVKAKYACGDACDTAPYRELVFTGSHNWTSSANSLNDELFVKIDDPSVYRAFVQHFDDTFASGSKKD